MTVKEKSLVTQVIEDSLAFYEEMTDLLAEEFSHGIGYQEVSRKELRGLIRKAIKGDAEAMQQVEQYHQTNQYPDGRNPVEDEINLMLKENKKGMSDLFAPPDIFGEDERSSK